MRLTIGSTKQVDKNQQMGNASAMTKTETAGQADQLRTVLFARHMMQAEQDYLRHLDVDDRRRVIVILRREDGFKIRGGWSAFCFLERWWENWNPVDANEAYNLWPLLNADRVWEVTGDHAVRYLLSNDDHQRDHWISSAEASTFRTLRRRDGLDALPGLDDTTHSPVGGIVFKEIFDLDPDKQRAYLLYANWYIRTHVRDSKFYLKEAINAVA